MKKISLGYLLVLGLIPSSLYSDFVPYLIYLRVVGALLLFLSLKSLKGQSHHIKEVTDLSLLLLIVKFLVVTVEMVNPQLLSGLLMTSLSVLIDLALFFISYKLYLGLKEIEVNQPHHYQLEKLFLALIYLVVLYFVRLIFVFEPVHSVASVGYFFVSLFFVYNIAIATQHVNSLS